MELTAFTPSRIEDPESPKFFKRSRIRGTNRIGTKDTLRDEESKVVYGSVDLDREELTSRLLDAAERDIVVNSFRAGRSVIAKRQQRQAPVEPNVTPSDEMKPAPTGTNTSDTPTPIDGPHSVSLSPPGGASAPSGAPSFMQPADGPADSQTAHGSAGLKLVGQSLAGSGDGDHAVKGNVSEAERHRRD